MSSRAELATPPPTIAREGRTLREKFVLFVAFSWGLCAFLPVGVMYLHLALMLLALAFSPDVILRLRKVHRGAFFPPIVLMLVWTLLAAAMGEWYPDSATRLFHVFRVALVLFLGMMLTPAEGRVAFAGFLAGALVATLIVFAHRAWGLPEWEIWRSLLSSRNNFSSGNMISMATASGICFLLAIRQQITDRERWLLLAGALAFAMTVALHAVSRNSQLLLVLLLMVSVLYRFRSLRATLGGLAAVVVLVAMAWQFSPTTQSRFTAIASNLHAATTEANYSTSVGVRWRMYQEAVKGMVEHPFFGTGLGSWLPRWKTVWAGLNHGLPPESLTQFAEINNPHNDFLLTGMETGVVGMLILLWLLAHYVYRGWQQRSTAGGITVVLGVTIFVTALVNAPFRDAALGMTLLWLLGVSVAGHKVVTDA